MLGGRDIVHVPADVSADGATMRTLLDVSTAVEAIGFNDLSTDAAGRIYAGSLAFQVFGTDPPKPGRLWRVDLDGTARAVSGGVMLTNGIRVSPDGRRLHPSDSRAGLVRVHDVAADGSLGPWRPFARLGTHGVPDGLKVAADGSVWVADAHGGRVAVFAPDGAHLRDLAVPLPMVTSLCYGGADLRDLYVVIGSRGGPSERCGTVFRVRVDVPGLPLVPARVAVGG